MRVWLLRAALLGAAVLLVGVACATNGASASGKRALVGYVAGGGSLPVVWTCDVTTGDTKATHQGTATLKARETTLYSADADALVCLVTKQAGGDMYLAIRQSGAFVEGKESPKDGANTVTIGP